LPTYGAPGTNFPAATRGVIVNPRDYDPITQQGPNIVFYFEPGVYATGGIGWWTAPNDALIGGYAGGSAAVLDGGGLTGKHGAFNADSSGGIPRATNVTLEYLDIQNWVSDQNQSVINQTDDDRWTLKYDTVGPNEYGPDTSGQNSGGGYGVNVGDNSTLTFNCFTQNAQGAINAFGGPSSSTAPAKLLHHLVIADNEISRNGLGVYPDYGGNPKSCGCSGGAKISWSLNTTFAHNYVHDNYNAGIWFDFNNAGATVTQNFISSNWSFGIVYEASYNADIAQNTVTGNGWASGGPWPTSAYCRATDPAYGCSNGSGPSSTHYGNESGGAIATPDSGGNDNVAGSQYSGHLYIRNNVVADNWSGIDIYQDDARFAGVFPNQCNSPLQGTNPLYQRQANEEQSSQVTVAGSTLTAAGGFTLDFGSDCSEPGPVTRPSPGLSAYDSAGVIPAGDTISSCASPTTCTLSTPAAASASGDIVMLSAKGGCGYADLVGSSAGALSGDPPGAYWDNCLWATRNVSVSGNQFRAAPPSTEGCVRAEALCNVMAIIDANQGFPAAQFDIYNGNNRYFSVHAPVATSPLHNVFAANTYTGAWQFETVFQGLQGNTSHTEWTKADGQDAGSTGL
jgi:hypothetical protein